MTYIPGANPQSPDLTGVMLFQGPWSGAVRYEEGHTVTSGGVTYVCILGHANQVPPNATYWTAIGRG